MAEENKEYLLKDKFASKFANVNFGYMSYQINNSDLEHTYSYIDYLPIEDKEKNQITHTFKIEQEKEGETKKYGSIILTLDEKRNNIIGFEYKKDDNVYKHEFKNSISIQNILDDNSYMDNLFKNHINNTLQKFLLTEEEKNKEDILNRDTNSQNNNNDNNDNSDTHISPESSSKKSSGVGSTIFSTLLGGAAFAAIALTTSLGISVAIATALSTFGITKSISKLFGKNQSSTYNYNTSYQQNVSSNPDLSEAINYAFENHDNENDNENNNNNNNNNNENENKNPDNSNNSKPKILDTLSGVGGDNNASEPPKTGDSNKPKGNNTPDQTPNI